MTTGKHRASILLRMTEAEKREIRRRADAEGASACPTPYAEG